MDPKRPGRVGESTASFLPGLRPAVPRGEPQVALLVRLEEEAPSPPTVISRREITLGRGADCDMVIDSETVSRLHAVIIHDNLESPLELPCCYIEDRASKNGLYINNVRVLGRTRLHAHDIIRLGEVNLGFFVRGERELHSGISQAGRMDRRSLSPGASRIARQINVHVQIMLDPDAPGAVSISGHSLNISLGGMALRTDQMTQQIYARVVREQLAVKVRMELPEMPGVLSLTGHIAWVRLNDVRRSSSCEFGLAFAPLQGDTVSKLEAFLLS